MKLFYPHLSCTHFNFYLDKPTTKPTDKPNDKSCSGDEKCTADDVNSYCNTGTGACECKKGFTADEASDKCVKGMYHND